MWNSILEVLEEKAEEGVDVRFMYDGISRPMTELFYDCSSRAEIIATFLALLELSKHGRVSFSENGDMITMTKPGERTYEAVTEEA